MKKSIITLYFIITLNTLSAMDSKSITLHNKTSEKITLSFEYYNEQGEKHSNHYGAEYSLAYTEKKTFNLFDSLSTSKSKESIITIPKLKILNAIPQLINLNVTDNGTIGYGDILTITENDKNIIITNTKTKSFCKLRNRHRPMTLGKTLQLPTNAYLPLQIFTIYNKSLLQVILYHSAYRNPSPCLQNALMSKALNEFPCDIFKKSITANDTLLKEDKTVIRSGETIKFTTFSSATHPNITETRTRLFIPEASPYIIDIIIDGKTIDSGDTLTVSRRLEDNTILITNQYNQILAKLQSLNHERHQIILG